MKTLKDYKSNWELIFILQKLHSSINWVEIYQKNGMDGVYRVKNYLDHRLSIQ